jgi:holo-[acyl-carrier protein] synthase
MKQYMKVVFLITSLDNTAGIGIDIIEIGRIVKIIERFSGKFLKRVFTPGEIAYCLRLRNSGAGFAARFAAKEAVLKAFGTGLSRGVRWIDIEVIRAREEAPRVALYGRAAALAREKGVKKVLLSMTHDKTKAVAFVILTGGEK